MHFGTVPFDHSGTSPKTEYAPMIARRGTFILLAPLLQLEASGIGLNARIDLWSLIYIVRRLPGSVLLASNPAMSYGLAKAAKQGRLSKPRV